MMREKERDDNSVGKAGAVERGVTRPKRRLSRWVSHCLQTSSSFPTRSSPCAYMSWYMGSYHDAI
jgi:hypothetical protein